MYKFSSPRNWTSAPPAILWKATFMWKPIQPIICCLFKGGFAVVVRHRLHVFSLQPDDPWVCNVCVALTISQVRKQGNVGCMVNTFYLTHVILTHQITGSSTLYEAVKISPEVVIYTAFQKGIFELHTQNRARQCTCTKNKEKHKQSIWNKSLKNKVKYFLNTMQK